MMINRYVNIGIVTFNRLEFTKQAIASIVKYTSFPHVITVVDNGSQDGTQEYLKKLIQTEIIKNIVLLERNIGVAKASNLAWLQEPNALYYLKYDNDIVIQKNNWLFTLVSVIDAVPEVGVIGYNFEPISYPLQVVGNHRIRIKEEGNIGGACFLIPKRTQDILGYWCEEYGLYGFEDVDYSLRVKLAGLLNAYMEDEKIGIHLPAGRAAKIDGVTWRASDGVEEIKYKQYRNFKDLKLKDNIVSGIVNKNFNEYIHRKRALYISTNLSPISFNLDDQAIFSEFSKQFTTEIYVDNEIQELAAKLLAYIEQYQQYPNNNETIFNFRQARKKIADKLLFFPENQLENVYLGETGKAFKMLINSSIKDEPLTDIEQKFVADLSVNISKGFDQPKVFKYLLALMLYQHAVQLPLDYNIEYIPQWFLNNYLKYMLESPRLFQKVGEADNYYRYTQRFVDYLHTSIFSNPDLDVWQRVANELSLIANFIPLYFNEENLKDIYVKRAEILEYVLKLNGYTIDFKFDDRPINRKKIRLGILAAHFMPAAETFAYLPVYEYISRDFEVILYSLQKSGHPLEQYCQSCANSFKQLPQDLAAQVTTIRADDLDILFIATNVTAVTNQICLLSMHRLARIQVTSGGSVVTTGMRHIDYYISGTLTDPSATAEEHYREKLVKLEGTAHCFSYGTEEGKETIKLERQSLGASDDAVVFISGANYFKIIPELIDTWAKIIAGVANSVLVLLPFGPNWSNAYPKKAFVNHLHFMFSRHEVEAERLMVLDPQPVPDREDVKEYFKIADVYLDSYPFAGTTSLIEPLQVNLPVIARQGTYFRSAMGAAILQALDVPGLVANSEESYIQLAIALGIDPKLRQQKSAQIKEKMQGNPCFLDSRSYSAKIGSLFQELLSNYLVETLSQNLRLGDVNLIIFPDWSQSEESISFDLERVFKTLATHPDSQNTTLLINISNFSSEDADLLLSAVMMNILMNEDMDVTEKLEISLVSKLTDIEWKALLPRIKARIILEQENTQAVTQVKAENLPSYNLDSFLTSTSHLVPGD
ncbi:O-linked N-acetylglucosamine transferase family protein [Mastigocladopsis repens]|uniref:O-linked N-acetylglucosamine transferase family protein n=1 Tax=Mastigocladopsis repens TaxID=221287 RepID=UPI000370146B|nr:glycosyltransferase [Mastigocladopsis repens]